MEVPVLALVLVLVLVVLVLVVVAVVVVVVVGALGFKFRVWGLFLIFLKGLFLGFNLGCRVLGFRVQDNTNSCEELGSSKPSNLSKPAKPAATRRGTLYEGERGCADLCFEPRSTLAHQVDSVYVALAGAQLKSSQRLA